MSNAAPKIENSKIITIRVVNGHLERKDKIRYNKDGTIDKRRCSKQSGESSEVYAFKTREEIKAMLDVFNKNIFDAKTDKKLQNAHRNKLLFIIGINIGIRASDLRTLRWSFFFDNNGCFKEYYKLQPQKQRKQHKYVTIYFNDAVKKAIIDYITIYPIENINDLLFPSQKGNAITEHRLYEIIKTTAIEAGIEQNIGSHSLRKTWGFWCWHEAEDKNKALVILQKSFNHDSTLTTLRYIGVLNSEIADMYNSIELGLELSK